MTDRNDVGGHGPSSFAQVFPHPEAAEAMSQLAPGFHAAAAEFWRVPMSEGHLSARMKELVLFAMHVSATSLNADAVKRQVGRVLAAGGTALEIADVVTTIASLANHSVYASVPILDQEWAAAGREQPPAGPLSDAAAEAKRRFVEIRGFWNEERDPILRQMPEYFAALTGVSTVTWETGPLTTREREFVCIGIDCTVTHSYAPGLRIHIGNAIREGASREEILEVFQLAALFGLEGYVMAAEALFAAGG